MTIDSVVKKDDKYFLQIYSEQCKYKIKKTQMSRFIDAELISDSDDDSDSDADYSDEDSDSDSDDDSDSDSDDSDDDSDK